jgi:hypothetical protein
LCTAILVFTDIVTATDCGTVVVGIVQNLATVALAFKMLKVPDIISVKKLTMKT